MIDRTTSGRASPVSGLDANLTALLAEVLARLIRMEQRVEALEARIREPAPAAVPSPEPLHRAVPAPDAVSRQADAPSTSASAPLSSDDAAADLARFAEDFWNTSPRRP